MRAPALLVTRSRERGQRSWTKFQPVARLIFSEKRRAMHQARRCGQQYYPPHNRPMGVQSSSDRAWLNGRRDRPLEAHRKVRAARRTVLNTNGGGMSLDDALDDR